MVVDTISQTLQGSKTLEYNYAKPAILKGELSSAEMFLTTMERFNPLLITCEIF